MEPGSIDRYGELDRLVRQFAPIKKEYEALAEAIRADQADVPAHVSTVLHGMLYEVQIGARKNERHFQSLRAVVKAVGMKQFLTVVTVGLGKLEALIGEPAVEDLVVWEQTGSRPLTAVAKSPVTKDPLAA